MSDLLEGQGKVKLLKLTKTELVGLCKERSITTTGSKEEIVDRLVSWKRKQTPPSSPSSTSASTATKTKASPSKGHSLIEELEALGIEDAEGTPLTAAQLRVFTLPTLKLFSSEIKGLSRANKEEIISALVASSDPVCLEHLNKNELKELCLLAEVSLSGNKPDLIKRLAPKAKATKKKPSAKKWSSKELDITSLVSGPMTKATYRKKLLDAGWLEQDQDVFHIIAFANGGADHVDNYHYAQNAAYNRRIGAKADHLNCYFAGKRKTAKAIKASVEHGKYKLSSKTIELEVAYLYGKGEAAFRDMFGAQTRH